MSNIYPRRQILKQGLSGLAGLSLLGLVGCSSSNTTNNALTSQSDPASGTLNMLFWGSATRDQLTRKTFDEFHQQNPSYAITSKYYTFDKYFGQLDALIAKGQAPDLIQMDMRYIAQYVRRKTLLDLTEIIYNQSIDLSDFDPQLLSSSKVNNTVYGIPLGGNYQAGIYNQELLDKANVGPIPLDLNWDIFFDYCIEVTKALGNNLYASVDTSTDITTFELFIRQRGKEMYTREGQVNFTQDDAGDWFEYWNKMRNAKGCLPWSIQKNMDIVGNGTDNSPVQGKAVFSFTLSNLYDSFQQTAFTISPQRKLNMMLPPTAGPGSSPAMYLKPSQLISISATTRYPQTASKYTSFIFNDINAVKTLGIERGIPGSTKGVNLLRPKLTNIQKIIADYFNTVAASGQTGVKTVLDPPGASKVQDLLRSSANDVASGAHSVSEVAQAFYTAAKKVAPTG